MNAAINIQLERELTAGEDLIKKLESEPSLSEVSRRAAVTEIKLLQRQHRWFKSGNGRIMAIIGITNLIIGTLMIVFISPEWGLLSYMGVGLCWGAYVIGNFGSRRYLKALQQHT